MQLTLDIPYKKNNWEAHYCCEVPGANVIGIMGRSGSGKSTLLRLISGLEPLTIGTLSFQGEQWLSHRKSTKPQLRNIAYVTQECLLFPHLSIAKNLQLASKKTRLSASEQMDLLTKTGVVKWLLKKPNELSGGQRQRVALVQAMIQTPKLLLCDEPLSALDTHSRYELISIIKTFISQHKIAMIYISHSDSEIQTLTDHCLIIDNGEIVQSDKTEVIFSPSFSTQHLAYCNTTTTLPFTVKGWKNDEKLIELNLADLTNKDCQPLVYLASKTPSFDNVLHCEISANDVVLSKEVIRQSCLENYFIGEFASAVENDVNYTMCVSVAGHNIYAITSKRAYKNLTISEGDRLYVYFRFKR